MLTLDEINALKTKLQHEGIEKWIAAGGRGAFVWATAVGKTHLATHNAIPRMNKKAPTYRSKVVVPREFLKKDWEGEGRKSGHIKKNKLKNVDTWVLNSFVRSRHQAEFLIIDEAHRASNEDAMFFSKVLDVCPAPYVLCLTATLTPDQERFLASKNIPIISRITTKEAEAMGLISPYRVYNLGVDLTEKDRIEEKRLHDKFIEYSGKFDRNMSLAIDCNSSTNPRWNPEKSNWYKPTNVEYAEEMGWVGNDLDRAVKNFKRRKLLPRGRKSEVDIWGDQGDEFEFTPTKVQIYASQYISYMNKRQDFLHNAVKKLKLTKKIIKKFQVPSIIFSQRTEFADRITNLLGEDVCRSYHSKLESTPLKDDSGEFIRYGKSAVKAGQIKIFGSDTLKSKAINDFEQRKLRVLSTAMSLDEGFNVDGIELAIITSGTSTERQNTQRIGRAVRAKEGKVAVIVNLYVKDSQDVVWLKKRQMGDKPALWIDDIDEITFGYDRQKIELEEQADTDDSDEGIIFRDAPEEGEPDPY